MAARITRWRGVMVVQTKQHEFLKSLSARALATLDLGPRDAPASMSLDELRRHLAGARLPVWEVLFELHAQLAGIGPRRAPGQADLWLFPGADDPAMLAPPLRARSGTILASPSAWRGARGGRDVPAVGRGIGSRWERREEPHDGR